MAHNRGSNAPELLEKLHKALEAKGYQALPLFYAIIEGNNSSVSTVCFFKDEKTADAFNDSIFEGGKGLTSVTNNGKKAVQTPSGNSAIYKDKGTHVIYLAPIDIGKLMPGESVPNSLIGKQYTPPFKIKGKAVLVPTPGAEKARAEQLMEEIRAHQILSRAVRDGKDWKFNLEIIANPEKQAWVPRHQHYGKLSEGQKVNRLNPATGKITEYTYRKKTDPLPSKAEKKYKQFTPKYSMNCLYPIPAAQEFFYQNTIGLLFHQDKVGRILVLKGNDWVEKHSWSQNAGTNSFLHVAVYPNQPKGYSVPYCSLEETKGIHAKQVKAGNFIKWSEHQFLMPKRNVTGLYTRTDTSGEMVRLLSKMYELRKAFEQNFNVLLLHLPHGKDSKGQWLNMAYFDYPQRLKAMNEILNTGTRSDEYQLLTHDSCQLIKNVVRDAYLEGVSEQQEDFYGLLLYCQSNNISIEKPIDDAWTQEKAKEFAKNKNQFDLLLGEKCKNNQLTVFIQSVFLIEFSQTHFLCEIKKFLAKQTYQIKKSTAPTTTAANTTTVSSTSSSSSSSSSSASSATSPAPSSSHSLTDAQQKDILMAAEQLYYFYLKQSQYEMAKEMIVCLAVRDYKIDWKDANTKAQVLEILFTECINFPVNISEDQIKNLYYLLANTCRYSIENDAFFRARIQERFGALDDQSGIAPLGRWIYIKFTEAAYSKLSSEGKAAALSSLFSLDPNFFEWIRVWESDFPNLHKLFQLPKEVFKVWAESDANFSKGICKLPINLDFFIQFLGCFSKDSNPEEAFIDLFLKEPQLTGLFNWVKACYEKDSVEFLKRINLFKMPKQFWKDIFEPWLSFFSKLDVANQKQCEAVTHLLFEKVPLNHIVKMSAQSNVVFLWESFSDFIIPRIKDWITQSNSKQQKKLAIGVTALLEANVSYRSQENQVKLVPLIMACFPFFEKYCLANTKALLKFRMHSLAAEFLYRSGRTVISSDAEERSFCFWVVSQEALIQDENFFKACLAYLSALLSEGNSGSIFACDTWRELCKHDLLKKYLGAYIQKAVHIQDIFDFSFIQPRQKPVQFAYPLVHLYLSATSNPPRSMEPLEIAWSWILWAFKQQETVYLEKIPELFKESAYRDDVAGFFCVDDQKVKDYFLAVINERLQFFVTQLTATHSTASQTTDALTAEQLFTLISLLPPAIRDGLDDKSVTGFLNQARAVVYKKLFENHKKFERISKVPEKVSLLSWVIEKDDLNHIASLDDTNSLCLQLLTQGMLTEFNLLINKKIPIFTKSDSLVQVIFMLLATLKPNSATKLLETVSNNPIQFTLDQGLALIGKAIEQFDFSLVEGIIRRTEFLILPEEKRVYELLQTLIFKEAYQAAELLASKIHLDYFEFRVEPVRQETILHVLAKNTVDQAAIKLLQCFYKKARLTDKQQMDAHKNTLVDYALLYQNQTLIQLIQAQPLNALSESEQHRLLAYYAIQKRWADLKTVLQSINQASSIVNVDWLLEPSVGSGKTTCNFLTTLINDKQWDLLTILLPLIRSFTKESAANLKSALPSLLPFAQSNSTVLALCCSDSLLRFWKAEDLLKLFLKAGGSNEWERVKSFLNLPDVNMLKVAADSSEKKEIIDLWIKIHNFKIEPDFFGREIKKTFASQNKFIPIELWFFTLIEALFENSQSDLVEYIFARSTSDQDDRINLFSFALNNNQYNFCQKMIPHLGSLSAKGCANAGLKELLNKAEWKEQKDQNAQLIACVSSFFEKYRDLISISQLLTELKPKVLAWFLESVEPSKIEIDDWVASTVDSVQFKTPPLSAWMLLARHTKDLDSQALSKAIRLLPELVSGSSEYKMYFIPTILYYLNQHFLKLPAAGQLGEPEFLSKLISVLRFYLQQNYVDMKASTSIFEALFSIKYQFSSLDAASLIQFFKNNPSVLYAAIDSDPMPQGLIYYACTYGANVVIEIPEHKKSVFGLVLEKGEQKPLSYMLRFSDLSLLSVDEQTDVVNLLCDAQHTVDGKQQQLSFFDLVDAIEGNETFSLDMRKRIGISSFMKNLERLETLTEVVTFYNALKDFHGVKIGRRSKHFFFYQEEGLFAMSVEGFGKIPDFLILLIKAIKNRILDILANESNSNPMPKNTADDSKLDVATGLSTNKALPTSKQSSSSATSNLIDSDDSDSDTQIEERLLEEIKRLLGQKRGWGSSTQSQEIYNHLTSSDSKKQAEGKNLLQIEQSKLDKALSKFGYQAPRPVTTADLQAPVQTSAGGTMVARGRSASLDASMFQSQGKQNRFIANVDNGLANEKREQKKPTNEKREQEKPTNERLEQEKPKPPLKLGKKQ